MIVAVTGTGTGIGKTHLACAVIGALRDRGVRAVGWKPVESGVTGAVGDDEDALRAASGGDVAAPTLRLRAPVAPNVAARAEGVAIDAFALRARLGDLASAWEVVVVELAGGMFSPFDHRIDNADWLAGLDARTLLVAPDRLGVLHDVTATVRAARAMGIVFAAIALVAQDVSDASAATNLGELRTRLGAAVHAVPRGPVDTLRTAPSIAELARALVP
ncbi:MAG: dethiobiotin synthase [Deltaproteobacteria bacterium]|nr:dethiobiotin synthase [Deltaproteobacteria bacterium]